MHYAVEPDGFAVASGVLGITERQELSDALGSVSGAGRRGLLALTSVAELARSTRLYDLVRPHVAREPFPVRAIYFDKSPGGNWLVPWHQDLTLAVHSRAEVPGFGPWSVKDGVPHVQPPVELLEQMLTVRLHLDDADEANGALRVLPGTQRLGRLSPAQVQEQRAQQNDVLCKVTAGDTLLMRPLLLHASGRSTDAQRHRRVLHIEYAAFTLPDELRWHEAAFQLLFAYLVDLIPLALAFGVAAAVSLALVGGYLRAAAGKTFAGIAALAQFVYLVLFSYSFFFDGLTGLTITIGSVVTLALLMALIAKVNWAAKFAGTPAIPTT